MASVEENSRKVTEMTTILTSEYITYESVKISDMCIQAVEMNIGWIWALQVLCVYSERKAFAMRKIASYLVLSVSKASKDTGPHAEFWARSTKYSKGYEEAHETTTTTSRYSLGLAPKRM